MGAAGAQWGTALISKHLKVGVIAHQLDRRVSQQLLCKDVEAGTDPAHLTGSVCGIRTRHAQDWKRGFSRGSPGKPAVGLGPPADPPLPTARGGGGVREGG